MEYNESPSIEGNPLDRDKKHQEKPQGAVGIKKGALVGCGAGWGGGINGFSPWDPPGKPFGVEGAEGCMVPGLGKDNLI